MVRDKRVLLEDASLGSLDPAGEGLRNGVHWARGRRHFGAALVPAFLIPAI